MSSPSSGMQDLSTLNNSNNNNNNNNDNDNHHHEDDIELGRVAADLPDADAERCPNVQLDGNDDDGDSRHGMPEDLHHAVERNADGDEEAANIGHDPNDDDNDNDNPNADASGWQRRRKWFLSLLFALFRLAVLHFMKRILSSASGGGDGGGSSSSALSLSVPEVLRLSFWLVFLIVSVWIECLLGRGLVGKEEAEELLARTRRARRVVEPLLTLVLLVLVVVRCS